MTDPSFVPPEPEPQPAGDAPRTGAALSSYLRARRKLFALEAAEAAASVVRKGALAGAAAGLAVFAYALLLAGLIGLVASFEWAPAWHVVALIAGGLHLGIALVLIAALRRPTPPAFPLTRQEMKKDSQWIQELKKRGNRH